MTANQPILSADWLSGLSTVGAYSFPLAALPVSLIYLFALLAPALAKVGNPKARALKPFVTGLGRFSGR